MAISYEWRGEFTSAEANALHAECFGHPVLGDDEWDWRGQVERHSLGWVCARDGAELVGFVNVAWDGVVHAFVLDTMVTPAQRVTTVDSSSGTKSAKSAEPPVVRMPRVR